MKDIYQVNLRGYDTSDFEENPIVLDKHDYQKPPIGRAKILKGKKQVEIFFEGGLPSYPHRIRESYTELYDSRTGKTKKILTELSVIPTVAL